MTQQCAAPKLLDDLVCDCEPNNCYENCSCLINEQSCTASCQCKAALSGLIEAEEADESICITPKTLQALFTQTVTQILIKVRLVFLNMQYMIGIKEQSTGTGLKKIETC